MRKKKRPRSSHAVPGTGHDTLPEALAVLRDTWLGTVGGPRVRAIIAGASLLTTIALLVARIGTPRARLAAVGVIGVVAIAIIVYRVLERRALSDPERTI